MGPSVNNEVMDGHVMRVFALQYHPQDDQVFVSGGWDNTIQWWDTRTSERYSIKKISGLYKGKTHKIKHKENKTDINEVAKFREPGG